MKLPRLALSVHELKILKKLNSSSHDVYLVSFKDKDGAIKRGYYKPLAKDYIALSAKYSTAVSTVLGLSLGVLVANERFVFENDAICGTLSIELKDFKHMITYYEQDPENIQEKELVNPSVATLLQLNAARLILGCFYMLCGDRHPKNFSFFGLPDFDEAWGPIACIIKGERLIQVYNEKVNSIEDKSNLNDLISNSSSKKMSFQSQQINNLPYMPERNYTPTREWPPNINPGKTFAAYKAFQELASNPKYKTMDGKIISYQDQNFEAILTTLLTFDPDTLRARLSDNFGEITLDFLSCSNKISQKLSDFNKDLFNTQTNDELFVDHAIKYATLLHEEFYRATVWHEGCKTNIGGVPVPAFNSYLCDHPEMFFNVKKWIIQENERLEKTGLYDKDSKVFFDLSEIDRRYHHIWRDSFAMTLKKLLYGFKNLANDLSRSLSPLEINPKKSSLTMSHFDLVTSPWQVIDEKQLEFSQIFEEEKFQETPLSKAYGKLRIYVEELTKISKAYFEKPRQTLCPEDNNEYFVGLLRLSVEYTKQINANLQNTSWENQFSYWEEELTVFRNKMFLHDHLQSKKPSVYLNIKKTDILHTQHTDEMLITACAKAFFDWANSLDSKMLLLSISNVLRKYKPSKIEKIFVNRCRKDSVIQYLKLAQTLKHTGDQILAYILSEGGQKENSLNTMLIEQLLPFMLHETKKKIEVDFSSLIQAFDKKEFQILLYTQKICAYAKTDPRFKDFLSTKPLTVFNETMYQWIKTLQRVDFLRLVNLALDEYDPVAKGFFGGTTKMLKSIVTNKTRGRTEILSLFDQKLNYTNSRILGLIFSVGGINEGSFNTILFRLIVNEMKKYKEKLPALKISEGINKNTEASYLKSLADHAKKWTFPEKQPSSSPIKISSNNNNNNNNHDHDGSSYDLSFNNFSFGSSN